MGMSITSSPRIPVYSTPDTAGLAAFTSMLEGDLCLQEDTSIWYYYNGTAWTLLNNPNGFQLIEHIDLTAAAAKDASFSSLGSYKYVWLVGSIATDNATRDTLQLQFNADTGNNYDYKYGTTTTVGTVLNTSGISLNSVGVSSAYMTNFQLLIPIEAEGTEHACTGSSITTEVVDQMLFGGASWDNAAAITAIKINNVGENGNLTGYATLYGINVT